ncbi:DUF5455 family protein [Colwellia sp. E2M01]|uniref:DUF5455 family protein n=1 Tax=Colwellia sp. E2M01 TaxID=2841561 RepID=UPI001C08B45A|nr:DUF5455 family protein [Colwellia sp. E2M01]MBU2871532.1 DUF5455 family protein [Colwellia sp. E2M01]
MGVIVTFFTTIISGITGLIGVFLARKAAFSVAYIAVYIALTVVFIAAINSGLSGITASLPTNSLLLSGFSMIPSNAGQCIGVVSSAHAASYIFIMKNKLLNLKVKA